MEAIWKMVLTFAVILLIASTGISVLRANAAVLDADDYMEELSAAIRESNYNARCISTCREDAEERGYHLTVQVYEPAGAGRKKYAAVCLQYPYRLTLFSREIWKKKERIL